MQGLPGSGKSTIAREFLKQGFSSDDFPNLYIRDDDGNIVDIDVTKLGDAHGSVFRHAVYALQAGHSAVIDNTNLSALELAPYVNMAQAFGAAPILVQVVTDPKIAFGRQTHGVPFGVDRNPETGEIVKTHEFGEQPPEGFVRVGGFETMMRTLEAFEAPAHWQFIPGWEVIER